MPESEITPTDEVDGFWSLTRDHFIGHEYEHDGRGGCRFKGVFKIIGIGTTKKRINKYVCKRTTDQKIAYIDIGYVLRKLADKED